MEARGILRLIFFIGYLCLLVQGMSAREQGPHRRASTWACSGNVIASFDPLGCKPEVRQETGSQLNYILSDTTGAEELRWVRGYFMLRDGRRIRDGITEMLDSLKGDYKWGAWRQCVVPIVGTSAYMATLVTKYPGSDAYDLWTILFSADGSSPTVITNLESSPASVLEQGFVDYEIVENEDESGYWIIVMSRKRTGMIVYPVSAQGLGEPVRNTWQSLRFTESFAEMAIDPSGTRLAMTGIPTSCGLARFDRRTGKVSDERFIPLQNELQGRVRETLCFSPDGSKLYVNVNGPNTDVIQLDLDKQTELEIARSATTIVSTKNAAWWVESDMEIGPDGKLYISVPFEIRTIDGRLDTSSYLATVHCPNEPGMLCNVDTFSIGGLRSYWLQRSVVTWMQTAYTFGVSDTLLVESMSSDSLVIVPTVYPCATYQWIKPNGESDLRDRLSIPMVEVEEGYYTFEQIRCTDTITSSYLYQFPSITLRLPDTTATIGNTLRVPIYVTTSQSISNGDPLIIDITMNRHCLLYESIDGPLPVSRIDTDSTTTVQIQLSGIGNSQEEQIAGYINVIPLLSTKNYSLLKASQVLNPKWIREISIVDGSVTTTNCAQGIRNIHFSSAFSASTVSIFNIHGREISKTVPSLSSLQDLVRFNELVAGLYIVRISNGYVSTSSLISIP